eukprot:scaffold212_cov138-Skeletonema_menzelii.AAC.2
MHYHYTKNTNNGAERLSHYPAYTKMMAPQAHVIQQTTAATTMWPPLQEMMRKPSLLLPTLWPSGGATRCPRRKPRHSVMYLMTYKITSAINVLIQESASTAQPLPVSATAGVVWRFGLYLRCQRRAL